VYFQPAAQISSHAVLPRAESSYWKVRHDGVFGYSIDVWEDHTVHYDCLTQATVWWDRDERRLSMRNALDGLQLSMSKHSPIISQPSATISLASVCRTAARKAPVTIPEHTKPWNRSHTRNRRIRQVNLCVGQSRIHHELTVECISFFNEPWDGIYLGWNDVMDDCDVALSGVHISGEWNWVRWGSVKSII